MASKPMSLFANNRLLGALEPRVLALFSDDIKEANFAQGIPLQEPGEQIVRVYFPQSGMISLLVMGQDGGGIEAATIGREGGFGLQSGLGKRRAFTRAVVQVAGRFSYISADRFQKAVAQSEPLRGMIAAYLEILWVEAQQIAACNAIHSAEARLCRWLLQTRDRIESDTVPLTQEFLSQMLGVRRTTVTLVARALQAGGLIKYSRGKIQIVDGAALENGACECYAALQQEGLPGKLGLDLAKR